MLKKVISNIKKTVIKPYIARIDITGDIDHRSTEQVIKSLKKLNTNGLQAIALTINSPGGSASQALIITERLTRFCKKSEIPLITFAQDRALSAGYMILSNGDQVYCHSNSIIGSIGAIYRNVKLHKLMNDYGIEYSCQTVNEGNLSDLTDPLINNIVQSRNSKHLKKIATNTKTLIGNFVRRNRPQASSVRKIWEGELLTGTEARGYYLVDDIVDDFQSKIDEEFPGVKIKNCTNSSYFERVNDLIGPFLVKSEFDLVKKKIIASLIGDKPKGN